MQERDGDPYEDVTRQYEGVQVVEPAMSEVNECGIAVEARGIPPQELMINIEGVRGQVVEADRDLRITNQDDGSVDEMPSEEQEVKQVEGGDLSEHADVSAQRRHGGLRSWRVVGEVFSCASQLKTSTGGYATPGTRGSRRTADAALSPGRVGVYARSGPWQSIAC